MQDPDGSSRPRLVTSLEECRCLTRGCDGKVSVDWSKATLDRLPPQCGGKLLLCVTGVCFRCKASRVFTMGEVKAREKGFLAKEDVLEGKEMKSAPMSA